MEILSTVTVSLLQGRNEKLIGYNFKGCVGQGDYQGIRRSSCKHRVYFHPLKHEEHLLALDCEVKNVL